MTDSEMSLIRLLQRELLGIRVSSAEVLAEPLHFYALVGIGRLLS